MSRATRSTIRKFRPRLGVLILGLCAMLSSFAESVETHHDLLAFVSIEGFTNMSDPLQSVDNNYLLPMVDVLYAYNWKDFRFLSEYVLSSEESEIERFQLGWQASQQTMMWFGRFHTISKYWTTEFHHGQLMQTSISRPGIEEWEDESGPMPSHITGLFIAHEVDRGDQSIINLDLAAGLGPVFDNNQLVPFDILNPGSENDLSLNLRASYQPDALSANRFGILMGWNKLPVLHASHPDLPGITAINQFSAGAFVDWHWDRLRVISSWMYINNDLKYSDGTMKDHFVAGYLQGEYQTFPDWTFFGRVETGFGEDNSPYLELLPAFAAHRAMLGLRWDFVDRQSLAMEVATTSLQGKDSGHENLTELRFQWSAVLP